MKKSFFAVAVFFLSVSILFAQENPQKTYDWNFSIEPLFGIRIGKEYEIVWANNSSGDNYKLSELEWEYKPTLYIGGKLAASYKRLELAFSSKFFLPANRGLMKDSDWLNGDSSTKTSYSESDNKIKTGQDIELLFAVKFYPTTFMTLRPRLSVNYNHFYFKAVGGTYWYGNVLYKDANGQKIYSSYDSQNIRTGSLDNDTVIEYDTHNLYIWTGIQIDFIPTRKITISLATETAPLIYSTSYDTHVVRKLKYKQHSLSSFYAIRQSASVAFNLNDFTSLSLNFSGLLTGETTGPSYFKEDSEKQTDYKRDGDAGNSTRYIDIGISAKISW